MTGRTFLAAIMLFVPITVAKVQAAPEDRIDYRLEGSSQVQSTRHYYKRSAAHKVSRPREEKTSGQSNLVKSKSGATARVNPTAQKRFQCLINKLDDSGYKIEFMGGYGSRPNNYSLHPSGRALDIDQVARGRLVRGKHYPKSVNINQAARKCGLLHGAEWADSDYGHFQVLGTTWVDNQEPKHWPVTLKKETAMPLPKPRPFYLPEPVQASIIPDMKLPEDAKPASYGLLNWLLYRETNYDNDTLPPPLRTSFVRSGPFVMSVKPETMQDGDREKIIERDEIASYLCSVYKRTPRKVDNTGDFTWKDIAAAKRNGRTLCQEVIGGMSRKTQEAFYKTGKKLDSMSIRWSMLSAFRDDWRQRIAAGIKACDRCSLHGGSRWGGYGNGQAVDVTIVGDEENGPKRAGNLFAKYGPQFGLRRPFPGFDPAHVQVVNYVAKKNNAHRWLASNEDAAKAKPLPVKITPDETKSDTAIVQATPGPTVDVVTLEMAPKAEPPVKVASLGNEVPLKGMKRVFELVKAEASKYDLDPKLLMAIAYLENGESWSGLERETMTSAMGIFGLTAPERARMRQKDHSLPEQVRAGVRHIAEDARGLAGALKRTPTSAEIYYAHWIGAGAAMSVIKAKDTDNLRVAIDRGEPGLGWRALKANPALAKMKNVAAFKRSIDERMREARGAIRA